MFDPSLGRWINEDPIEYDAGDTDLYRYVGNNPINETDPAGLDPPNRPGGEYDQRRRALQDIPFMTPERREQLVREGEAKSRELQRPIHSKTKGGKDLTDRINAGLKLLDEAWAKLDDKKKSEIASTLFSLTNPGARDAWDISQLIKEGGRTGFLDGNDSQENTVTVDGKVYYAPAVNYVLFGRMTKLCGEDKYFNGPIKRPVGKYEGYMLSDTWRFFKQFIDRMGTSQHRGWFEAGLNYDGNKVVAPQAHVEGLLPSTNKYTDAMDWYVGNGEVAIINIREKDGKNLAAKSK